jgi:hypothetical protein
VTHSPLPDPVDEHTCRPGAPGEAALSRRNLLALAAAVSATGVVGASFGGDLAAARPRGTRARPLTLERLVPGFLDIVEDGYGNPIGDGWGGRVNPWGAYTAHQVRAGMQWAYQHLSTEPDIIDVSPSPSERSATRYLPANSPAKI